MNENLASIFAENDSNNDSMEETMDFEEYEVVEGNQKVFEDSDDVDIEMTMDFEDDDNSYGDDDSEDIEITMDEEEQYSEEYLDATGITIYGKKQNYIIADVDKNRTGKGNQSSVFHCRGANDGEPYIVKVYKPELLRDSKRRANLEEILQFLYTNNCDSLVKVLEYGNCTIQGVETIYAIMDVYEKLESDGYVWKNTDDKAYQKQIVSLVKDINKALSTIHDANPRIFHGDIKPDNIMWNPKTKKHVLIDFGAAVQTVNDEETQAIGHALSQRYMAPERINNKAINIYTDYFSFGVTIAEFIDGTFPRKEEMENLGHKELKGIYEYRFPTNLPEHYLNLISGLLYKSIDNDYEEIKSNRWENTEVISWIKTIEKGNLDLASTLNRVNIKNEVSRKVETNEEISDFGAGIKIFYKDEKDDGTKSKVFTTLNGVVDFFVQPNVWRSGINDVLMDTELFTKSTVTQPHVLREIENARKSISDARKAKETGLSVDGEFFKFVYKYVSDPKQFYWKYLPDTHNLDDISLELEGLLRFVQKNGDFGEWWVNIDRGNRTSKHTIFAEIFRNDILSTYLKRAGFTDQNVLRQCRKVEEIFKTLKTNYTNEEIAEIFLLHRLLEHKDFYEFPNGVKYNDYAKFLKDVEGMSNDINQVKKLGKMLNSIKGPNGFIADFLAWKKLLGVK